MLSSQGEGPLHKFLGQLWACCVQQVSPTHSIHDLTWTVEPGGSMGGGFCITTHLQMLRVEGRVSFLLPHTLQVTLGALV